MPSPTAITTAVSVASLAAASSSVSLAQHVGVLRERPADGDADHRERRRRAGKPVALAPDQAERGDAASPDSATMASPPPEVRPS